MRRHFFWALILLGGCGNEVYIPGDGGGSGTGLNGSQTRLSANDRLRNACSIGEWTLDDYSIEAALAQADAYREEGYSKDQVMHNSQVVCTYECQAGCYGYYGGNCPNDEDSQCNSYCDDCVEAIVSQAFR